MTHANRFHKTGGPEVLQWEEVQVGRPGPGEARVRHTAIGLDYVDTYFRSGLYPASLPNGLGTEGAGLVEEIGPGVIEVKVAIAWPMAAGLRRLFQRAGHASRPPIPLPDGISDPQAAAMMLRA